MGCLCEKIEIESKIKKKRNKVINVTNDIMRTEKKRERTIQ